MRPLVEPFHDIHLYLFCFSPASLSRWQSEAEPAGRCGEGGCMHGLKGSGFGWWLAGLIWIVALLADYIRKDNIG